MADETLKTRLVRHIETSGPLNLADYMGWCLMDPTHGYYTRAAVFGVAGDFITAPDISQMFGELVGLALLQAWRDQGAAPNAILVELGPGRGTLMQDIRRAIQRHWQPQIHFVEASPQLRAQQKARHPEAHWHNSIDSLPADVPIFMIANEFFDALPIRQFQRQDGVWRERVVSVSKGELHFALTPPVMRPENGSHLELRLAAEAILGQISAQIVQYGGAALVIDYGEENLTQDTFQAVKAHRFVSPLEAPGTADLTSHVDFGALRRGANAQGAHASPLTPQGLFLERLGLEMRRDQLARVLEGPALTEHLAAARRLCHPDEMGQLFKVLGITPPQAAPLAGLE